jgi:hypothetical protein
MGDEREDTEAKPTKYSLDLGGGEVINILEGLTAHYHGKNEESIRTSDSRGWTTGADIQAGAVRWAEVTGIPSHNEDLTLDACRTLIQRLNQDGATWGQPVPVDPPVGGAVDAMAVDTRDRKCHLRMQVTRAYIEEDFWQRFTREKRAELEPGTVEDLARRIWAAIEHKRPMADLRDTLVLNAIRVDFLALPSVVEAFRGHYLSEAAAVGFQSIWIVGRTKNFVRRLDA